MNLYTPAEGLLGTHVTWEDIEEDMQRELHTSASFGPNKSAKNIGEGKGFASKILLIDPDWQNKDKDLPVRFVAKIITQLVSQNLPVAFTPTNKEEEEKMKEFLLGAEMFLKQIYYMKDFSETNHTKGYIIMQYLENAKLFHIHENVPVNAIKQVLRAKAVMEAMSLRFTAEEKKNFTEQFFIRFESVIKSGMLDMMLGAIQKMGMDNLAEKFEKLQKLMPELLNLAWADQLADELGMQRVLCHGDLWSTNLLWSADGDNLTLAAVIDFQQTHMGCAATDLARLFGTCLSSQDRRDHSEKLVEEFYGYLKEEVGDAKMPYTLEQLRESYRLFLPLGLFLNTPMFGLSLGPLCQNPTDEESRKGIMNIMEKLDSILDDVNFCHEKNMERKKAKKVA